MISLELLSKQNPVLGVMSDAKREELLKAAISRHYRKGEAVTHAGDIWPYLFLIAEGGINALKESSEGRSLVAITLGAGEIFWGMAFFHPDMPMPVALRTCASTRLLLWPREQMLPYIKNSGDLSWELCRLMTLRMLRASEILEEMTFQPVAGRLARLLMDTIQENTRGPITRSLTLDEMAARIGSTREMVCRFLHRFADDGIIDITRTEFSVMDKKRLIAMMQNPKG